MIRNQSKLVWALAAVTLVFAARPVVRAADAPAPPAKTADEKVKKTDMDQHMELIEDSMKKLRRTVRKADGQAESLDLLSKIEQEALTCKSMIPTRAATLPEAQRPKFIADFRKGMAGFITQVLQMESAVLDGNADQAMTLYKALKTTEDDSHDKFMPEDQKDKAKGDSK